MSKAIADKQNGAHSTQAEQLPAISGPRLPYHPLIEERFGIDRASWKALVEAIFPSATSVESVILALSYCRARKLDPFKRNVHIVPIWDKNRQCMVDTIWPGIGELRTTAFRTGEYAGRGETAFGPDRTTKVGAVEMTFPEWAQVTVSRIVKGVKVDFAGPRVYWLETYATKKHDVDTPNEMWATRPRGQIEKAAEAAALRAAFPEEIGSDYIPEEVQHTLSGPRDVEAKITTGSKSDALAARLKGPESAAAASEADEAPYDPNAMAHAGEESQDTGAQTFDDPPSADALDGLGECLAECVTIAAVRERKAEFAAQELTAAQKQHLDAICNQRIAELGKKPTTTA